MTYEETDGNVDYRLKALQNWPLKNTNVHVA